MIVPASDDHIEQILSIERSSFSKPWSEYHFMSDLNNKISINWVYLNNIQVKGYLFGWHVMDEYHLNNIAVAKRFRENGIAIHLIKNMVLYLNDIKVRSVLLEVSSSNLPARELYKKMGFVPQGERKDPEEPSAEPGRGCGPSDAGRAR